MVVQNNNYSINCSANIFENASAFVLAQQKSIVQHFSQIAWDFEDLQELPIGLAYNYP